MQRFSELLYQGLKCAGHDVRLVRPPASLGRIWSNEEGFSKWIGYIDRFLLYPALLRKQARWADLVHICDQANAVYLPYLGRRPHVITCHDLLAIRAAIGDISESPTGFTGRVYQRWVLRNLSRAHLIVCVSQQTKKELVSVAAVRDTNVAVVSNGLNYPYRPMKREQLKAHLHNLNFTRIQPFFLHVGGNQWYKNRIGVLRIFSHLLRKSDYRDYHLIMVGKQWTKEMHQLIQELKLDARVHEFVDTSNDSLCALYTAAEALLFPSLQEGFGWPIVEAQACGCPVITTDLPPMNVISGDAGIYIDPTNPEEAANIIVKGLRKRDQIVAKGLSQSAQYSSDTMISGYLRIYETLSQ